MQQQLFNGFEKRKKPKFLQVRKKTKVTKRAIVTTP